MTPSFNRLVEAVTDDELSKLNTLDLEDPSSLNKYFKPRKVMPIPPNVAATIGRYKPSEVGRIFSACAQEIIDTSTNDSSTTAAFSGRFSTLPTKLRRDRARTKREPTYPSSSSSGCS